MNQLTDVAQSSLSSEQFHGPLNWVGMENIKVPLEGLTSQILPAAVSAYVSLSRKDQRGIHMSRIYELVQILANHAVSQNRVVEILDQMIATQKGSANAAKILIKASPLLKRKALISEKTGFKSYPVRWLAQKKAEKVSLWLAVSVDYSSTCPCSAALAREAIAKGFVSHFSNGELNLKSAEEFLLNEETWAAWPHSQRSQAKGFFKLNLNQPFPEIESLIDEMEKALGTPTQTAVKRIDEQEFARLNAQNLMFCEDAARRLKRAFQSSDFLDFKFQVRHFESLHSHDVFAESRKF